MCVNGGVVDIVELGVMAVTAFSLDVFGVS